MRYVVTGGAGFVGSHLVKLLVREGHNVRVIDNLHSGKKENLSSVIEDIEFIEKDIRDTGSIENYFKNIDGIFHQAALTVVQDSFTNPEEYNDVNVNGTENIFRIAQKNNTKVVFGYEFDKYTKENFANLRSKNQILQETNNILQENNLQDLIRNIR